MRHLLLPNIQLNRLGRSKVVGGFTFFLRDEFLTDDPNPITSPRSAEPTGLLVVVDNLGTQLSISAGRLQVTISNNQSYVVSQDSVSRIAGLAVFSKARSIGATSQLFSRLGFATVNNSLPAVGGNSEGMGFNAAGAFQGNAGAATISTQVNYAANTDYDFTVILRSSGAFYIIDNNLMWVDASVISTPLYPFLRIGGTAVAGSAEYIRALNLGSYYPVWADNYGIATQRIAGAISNGQTFTHEANCLIEWIQTTRPSAGDTFIRFRIQDANNYWRIGIDSGGTFSLVEVVAGAPTTRATAAAVITNGQRIIIIADGTTIRGYSNDTLRWTYSSASNFQAATSGEVSALGTGGAVSDLITWPRTLTGIPAASLNAVVNA